MIEAFTSPRPPRAIYSAGARAETGGFIALWLQLFACICLALISCTLFAAPSLSPRFERIGDPALRSLTVLHMLQDRQGFIWLATGNGLYRYDGYQSISFKNTPGDARTLTSNTVTSLFEDDAGRLWVGTSNGLVRFNPETNDFTAFSPASGPAKFRNVRLITSDHLGGMWVGTWGGLQHFNPQTGAFRQYLHDAQQPDSLADNNVNALAVDKHGGLWVGLWQTGLDYLPAGASTFQHYPRIDTQRGPDPLLNTARALLLDSRERLWIGTEGGVVVWQTGTDWSLRKQLPDTPEFHRPRVFSILEDRDGTIWVGSITDGLARRDDGNNRFVTYQRRAADIDSLSSRSIRSLLQDRQGMLWIGTAGEGIARLNLSSQGFSRYLPNHSSPNLTVGNTVRAMAREDDTHLWVGALNGLHLLDLSTQKLVTSFQAEPNRKGALGSNTIYSLYREPGGPLWVGTMSGLYKLEKAGGNFQPVDFGTGPANYINMIRPGSAGTLWLVTSSGVMHYNPATGSVQTYRHEPANPNSRSITSASDVLEDRQGRVWMVDQDGVGLDMLDLASGKFSNFRYAPNKGNGLSSNRATRLHEDDRGNLWIATPNGLNRATFQADGSLRFHSWGKKDGLPFTSVYSMEHDAAGNIWLTTDVGISRLDPGKEKFTNYSTSDGITGNFANCLSFVDQQGVLYFGSINGITAVTPHAVRVNMQTPQLAITDISVFNQSLHGANRGEQVKIEGSTFDPKALTLSWTESVFAIEFSALQFDAPELIRYAYRLEGFDRDWVETDASHRIATYTHLDPGQYVFRVKAANSKGIWNDTGIALPVTISPPFWMTWWFRLLIVATLLGSVATAYRLRIRQLVKQRQALEALVIERTVELEESNERLANLSMTDGLTGIANRRRFDEVLTSEWNRAKRTRHPVAVAMLDVDWFKKYNDHYGHQAGDECLRQVAQTFAANIRRAGDLAARYGGEEFVLIAPAMDTAEMMKVAAAIQHALERLELPHAMSPYGRVTASIGVASIIPAEHDTPDTLLKKADEALYQAKEQGRNQAMAESALNAT